MILTPIVDTTRCSVYLKTVDCCPRSVPVLELSLHSWYMTRREYLLYYTLIVRFAYCLILSLGQFVLIYIGEPGSGHVPTVSQSLFEGLWSRQAMPSVCEEAFGC